MHRQAEIEKSGRPRAQNTSRRKLLRLTGINLAALGMALVLNLSHARAQDMSNGADNFYTSDKVTVQKVTFRTNIKWTSQVISSLPTASIAVQSVRRSSWGIQWVQIPPRDGNG